MAQITITTSAEQDAAIQFATAQSNLARAVADPNATPETPRQFFDRHILNLLTAWVNRRREALRVTRGELYQRATAEDQAAVDAILDRYRLPTDASLSTR